jgi:hypothetical protein
MVMPNSVVVAGQTFSVSMEPMVFLQDANHPNAVGRMNEMNQTIRLANELGPDALRETFLHEVLHVARGLSALPVREREVTAMGSILVDTLRRNPKFVAWLMED